MFKFLILSVFLTLNIQGVKVCPRPGDDASRSTVTAKSPCSEQDPDQDKLLQEAEKNGYTTRRVCFWGNEKTRDIVFRRTILLNEGDSFSYDFFQRSLRSLSKLKEIYPVGPNDVKASFDKDDQAIDLIFCVKEREKKKK